MTAIKERRSSRAFADRPLSPQTLSNLLWAAIGISDPESGKLTVPNARSRHEIDVFVVTASGDCAEVHGYADRTLGAFSGDEGLLDTALAIIQAEWSRQRAEWDQRRWERVNDPGCFLLEALEAAADEVWSDVAGEGEADPEESYEDFDLQEPIPEEG